MLIELIADRNNCELEFEIVLPNERAKKYYKRTIKQLGKDDLVSVKEEMLSLFQDEWINEAKSRLPYKFLMGEVLIDDYNFQGKGHPITLRCIVFYEPSIKPEMYKGFEMNVELPRINEEDEMKERLEGEFYELCEYVAADVVLEIPGKFKACIKVYDKATGNYDEDLSDTEFCDFLEVVAFPDKVLTALEGSKAGDHKEIEAYIDEDDYYFEEYVGMTLIYKIDIEEVYVENFPEEFTDAMAQEMGFQDLNAIKEKIKETIQRYSDNIYKRAFLKEYYREVASRSGFMPSDRMLETERVMFEEMLEYKPKFRRNKLRGLITDEALRDEIFADVIPSIIAEIEGYKPSLEDVQNAYNSKPDALWEIKAAEDILEDSLVELESDWLFNKASQEFVKVKISYVDKEPEFNGLSLLL